MRGSADRTHREELQCPKPSSPPNRREDNAARKADLERDYASARRAASTAAASPSTRSATRSRPSHVAIPSWGVGTGGTRFARFPGAGEPRDIFDKIEDCAVIKQLTQRDADRLAAHPVGQGRPEPAEAGGLALRPRLRRDELQHLLGRQGPDALLQVRLAVATPTQATRRQAVEHNLECIEIGKTHRLARR